MERAAAELMLDAIHDPLPRPVHDTNTYALGNIGPHNIVIACLSDYGPVKATSVLTHLIRTFPSVQLALMVGIDGGVPGINADIRLGDVVVGTRVMPYDLSKVVSDGTVERTNVPRMLHNRVGTVLSTLRAKHDLVGSQIQSLLEDRTGAHPNFRRPDARDRLFQATYSHAAAASSCNGCDPAKIVRRPDRTTTAPQVYYGAIASGHQVVKDGVTRDKYARSLNGILCFEMEAAGLMDELPCLPIRAICDYCDSHKNKEWQSYAAAVAAAYAREFVELLPVEVDRRVKAVESGLLTTQTVTPIPDDPKRERRKRLLQSLDFDQIDSRRLTIKTAHSKTCRWLLQLPDYRQWLDREAVSEHHGFLWLRGKPGVGKSTIMKFIYKEMKSHDRPGSVLTLSYFFNARGAYLERSIAGLYRSLLFQLLDAFPDLQDVFDDTEVMPRRQEDCPSLQILRNLFESAVAGLGERSLTCYIDALDECDEQQIIDMVQYFEELSESSMKSGVHLKVCFSSRHYPYIDVRVGVRLVLEDQPGHNEDLAEYIRATLRIQEPSVLDELQARLISKSAGVFLWIFLVVDMLNREDRRGRLALQTKLAEIPSGLTELFRDLITRDSENMEAFRLSVTWLLCAKTPLAPVSYHHAIWSGLAMQNLVDAHPPDVRAKDSKVMARKSVISTSKGLAEITRGKRPVVQFIHESVRDFLIKDGGLCDLWPDWGMDWEAICHNTLKECCEFYWAHGARPGQQPQGCKTLSGHHRAFLDYAVLNVLHHADLAATSHKQDAYLANLRLSEWIVRHNKSESAKARHYTPGATLLYVLADRGHARLVRAWLEAHPSDMDINGDQSRTQERWELPFFAALNSGNADAAAAVVGSRSATFHGCDVRKHLTTKRDFEIRGFRGRNHLTWAATQGLTGIVTWLLGAGASPSLRDKDERSALSWASQKGHVDIVKALLRCGARTDSDDSQSPLQHARLNCQYIAMEAIIDQLIRNGLDWHNYDFFLAFRWALQRENGKIIMKMLPDKLVHVPKDLLRRALQLAIEKGLHDLAKKLLEGGVEPNDCFSHGELRPIFFAAGCGRENIVRLLLNHGADINLPDYWGDTALTFAVKWGRENINTAPD